MKNKKKINIRVLETILICCEGDSECALTSYLKDIFHKRGSGFRIKIINGYGGSPVKTVERAVNQIDYDKKYAWIDTDRGELEAQEARRIAGLHKIVLVENVICIESEIMKIREREIKGTFDHKGKFKKNFPFADLTDIKTYETLLNGNILKKGRKNSIPIDQIIGILEIGSI